MPSYDFLRNLSFCFVKHSFDINLRCIETLKAGGKMNFATLFQLHSFGLLIFALAVTSFTATAAPLTLQHYLEQVSTKHLGLRAAEQIAHAAKLYSGESSTIYAPNLIAGANAVSEGRSNPLAPDQHFAMQTYSLGVSQATAVGLNGKATYNYLSVPGSFEYHTGYYQLELSASLFRNLLGVETRNQTTLIESGELAKAFAHSFAAKSMLLDAEANYWRLALAREMVNMQKEAVGRAQKMFEWTNRRVRLQLVDRSESLQATTNLHVRGLDLRMAENEERSAALAFNSSRGSNDPHVAEGLTLLNPGLVQRMNAPARTTIRDDVRAAEQQARASTAKAELGREKTKPTLELFGSALLTDPTAPTGTLALLMPISARPQSVVGVKFSAPLNLSTLSNVREGYAAEARAADWQYQRKVFEEERDWQDLTTRFGDVKERFRLVSELEKTQKEKFDFERERHSRGRSTLQQVLFFESDYEHAQLVRLKTLTELLTLNAQMKLYGVAYESR
jgi:outer membrane protein TolC